MLRDTGESLLLMHELEYTGGEDNVEVLRWLLLASDWGSARLGLASLPGGPGLFAACAVPAAALEPQALAWGVEQVLRLADEYDRAGGRRMILTSPSSSCSCAATSRDRPHLAGPLGVRPPRPPALWPFSLPLWRGVAARSRSRAPRVLVLIGGGIAGDLIGEGRAGLRHRRWASASSACSGIFLLAFPITFFNRPRFLVPPHQRDEPGAVEEWRAARSARR